MLNIIKDLHLTVQNIVAGIAFISQNSSENDSMKWEIKNGLNQPLVTISYKLSYEESLVLDDPEIGQSLKSTDKLSSLENNYNRNISFGTEEDKDNASYSNSSSIENGTDINEPQIPNKTYEVLEVLHTLPKHNGINETKDSHSEENKFPCFANLHEKSEEKSMVKPSSEHHSSSIQEVNEKISSYKLTSSNEYSEISVHNDQESSSNFEKNYFEQETVNKMETKSNNLERVNLQNDNSMTLSENSQCIQSILCETDILKQEIKQEKEILIAYMTGIVPVTNIINQTSEQAKIANDWNKEPDMADETSHLPSRQITRQNRLKIDENEVSQEKELNDFQASKLPCDKHKNNCTTYRVKKLRMCKYCGKKFLHKMRFIEHERIHTGEKPYTCKYCNKAFSRPHNKTRHERIHVRKAIFM